MTLRLRTCLFVLLFLFSPTSSAYAEAIFTRELTTAVEQNSTTKLKSLLLRAGISKEKLAASFDTGELQSVQANVLFTSEQYLIVRVLNTYGYGLWVFFNKSKETSLLLGTESYGRYPDFLQDPMTLPPPTEDSLLFAVHAQASSGTGVLLTNAIWQLLSPTGVRTLLTYPTGGHVVGWDLPFDREFDAKTISFIKRQDHYALFVNFTATYTIPTTGDEKKAPLLFTMKAPVRYVYDLEKQTFTLDRAHSALSHGQIDGLFNDAEEKFLFHNFEQLQNLARAGTPQQKEWLRIFLDTRPDSLEKVTLLQLLHK